MDVPHTAFVHSGWFRKASTAKRAEATVELRGESVHVEYFQPDESIGFTKWLLNPDGKPMTHTDRFFMPNVTRVDYMWGESRGFVITSQITPVTRDRAIDERLRLGGQSSRLLVGQGDGAGRVVRDLPAAAERRRVEPALVVPAGHVRRPAVRFQVGQQ